MKYFWIILFFFFTGGVQAQADSTDYAIQIDSLQQLINSQADDEKKVRLLNEYARLSFYNNAPKQGILMAHEARELAKKLEFEEGMVMYYLTLSFYYREVESGMSSYYKKKAQLVLNTLDEQLNPYSFYFDLPTKNLDNSVNEAIKKEFIELQNLIKDLNDIELEATVLFSSAGLNNEIELIDKNLERSIQLFSEIDETVPVFLISRYRMNVLIFQGKTEEAKKMELELIKSIAQQKDKNAIGLITNAMANYYSDQGRWAIAIEYYLKTLEFLDPIIDKEFVASNQFSMGVAYENLGLNSKAVDSYTKCIALLTNPQSLFRAYGIIVFPLIALNRYEEAERYMNLSLQDNLSNKTYLSGRYNDAQGQMLKNKGKYNEAIPYFKKALDDFQNLRSEQWALQYLNIYLAECYYELDSLESALSHVKNALGPEIDIKSNNNLIRRRGVLLISQIYEKLGNQALAYEYLKVYQEMRAESDELDETNRVADAEVRSILEESQEVISQLEQEQLQKIQESEIQRLWLFSIAGALILVIILTLILYRNNQNKRKANILLEEQKDEIVTTLEKLKSTQSQLIQSEKMASLGELTAGIAHEIQNPLNFVNNFSEVSTELIDEMNEELDKGDIEEAKAIGGDLKENLTKINHHGKRAGDIVKGMLQHSRTGAGKKEPTDINALADEYLRLAYHGLRAKDKSFNADFKTDLAPDLPKVNIVPQDIGRVLLNLINNAFYAVKEVDNPQVTVTSRVIPLPGGARGGSEGIEITVKDNGPGIPSEIKEKIFQPFFTTKPTGSGTGLGLSLSYDIVKAHGGTLDLNSDQVTGTSFTLTLPVILPK